MRKKFPVSEIHTQGPQRSGDENRQYGYRQNNLTAGKSHGQGNGTDGGLNGGLGQVGDDTEQPFFRIQPGSQETEADTDSPDRKGRKIIRTAEGPASRV